MFDLNKIISETKNYNFHTHSQFCDGRSTIAEIAESAFKNGIRYLGFSPHSPIPLISPCNMSDVSVGDYFDEMSILKSKYSGKMEIFTGMEIDYLSDDWCASSHYFKSLNLDYTISSVHFIPYAEGEYVDVDGRFDNFKIKMEQYFDNDIRAVVESFYRQSLAMVSSGGFDIIGHFDKIGHNASNFMLGIENEEWYAKLVRNLFDAIMDNNLIVEINTKAYREFKRFFPNQRYFDWLVKYDVPVVINSDAHYAEYIQSGRSEAFELLEKLKN